MYNAELTGTIFLTTIALCLASNWLQDWNAVANSTTSADLEVRYVTSPEVKERIVRRRSLFNRPPQLFERVRNYRYGNMFRNILQKIGGRESFSTVADLPAATASSTERAKHYLDVVVTRSKQLSVDESLKVKMIARLAFLTLDDSVATGAFVKNVNSDILSVLEKDFLQKVSLVEAVEAIEVMLQRLKNDKENVMRMMAKLNRIGKMEGNDPIQQPLHACMRLMMKIRKKIYGSLRAAKDIKKKLERFA